MSSGATSPPSAKILPTVASSSLSTTATSAPVIVVAANNGKSKQPASENNKIDNGNNNLFEISIDTSSHFVDIRQQDSGSNQSGSDSGLGYTNSISSDNSSFIVANGQDQTASKQSSNSNSNNNTLLKQNSPSQQSTTKQEPKEIELSAFDETRTSSIEPNKNAKQSPKSAFKPDHATQLRFESDDELGRHSSRDVIHQRNSELVSTTTTLTVQPSASAIKPLLKKSSQFNDANNSTNQPKKHNRNVSFNQTVIVFCEETELPSSVDQFDPPVGYQDSIGSFEPPEDYCDHKNGRIERSEGDIHDNEASSANFNRVLKNNSPSNLNDDQLFGLLDNDSLLESFKINCEDFSEDDFPINYLNSNHSYLCNDAISDYDSDSESSLCVERDRRTSVLPPVTKLTQHVEKDTLVDVKLANNNQEKLSISSPNDANHIQSGNHIKHSRDEQAPLRSTKLSGNQKSMPARMKVSTVDCSHSKRNLVRKEDAGSKLRIEPSQSSGAKQLHLEQKEADAKSDAARLTPIVVKQSCVEQVSLSKPIIVRNNFNNLEQSSNVDRAFDCEPGIVTSGSQSLVVSEQPNLIKECNMSKETVVTQASKLQHFNQASINANQTPTSQQNDQPACHICKVIESSRSQTNYDPNGSIRQDFQSVKPVNHNNIERDSYESQPNQIQFVKAPDNQPIVFNQSCVSCREALMKQQQQAAQQNNGTRTTAQPVQSVTYQLVYVVDQKGNRVRALSVRPAFNTPIASLQQAALAGRRILIAQNGQRFQNPISFTDQVNNLEKNRQVTAHPQYTQNLISNNNTRQYRIIDTAQPSKMHQAQHQQVSYVRSIHPIQKVPLESSGLRQHTVYYVRQPLDTQNIRQSYDIARSNYKSFPDPHEIRRLDGLKGPTGFSTISLSRSEYNTESGEPSHVNIISKESSSRKELSRDDADDPTFGFSKRPSVKVVATTSHSQLGNLNTQSITGSNKTILDSNHEHYINNMSTLQRCPTNQPVNIRPISLVMASQTLDRRTVSSQQSKGVKENIPSTSSMSNIHGTLVGMPKSKVSNISTNQQNQRISNVQTINANMDKLAPKDARINKLDTCRNNVNNPGEIVTNNRVAQVLSSQVRQMPNLKHESSEVAISNEQSRKTSEQSKVVYSMNI